MNLEQRIARLERQNSILKLTTFAMLGAAGLAALAGATARPDRTVRAEKFELIDENGKARGALSVQGYGSRLLLRDCHGQEQLIIHAAANPEIPDKPGDAGLDVRARGETRVLIQGTSEGGEVTIRDRNGEVIFRRN